MKRREFLKAAGAGLAASTAVAGTGDRAVDAGNEMAVDHELSEVARHAVRRLPRCSPRCVAEATDNKFQIQVFAAGEIVPGLQALDAVQQRHGRDVPHRVLLLLGKDPTFALRAPRPFGLNTRMQNAWLYQGGGMS